MRKSTPQFVLALTLFIGLPASVEAGSPGGSDSPIFPADSKSYGEMSAKFWQWAISFTVDMHPLYDTADCSAGQTGKTWFLGGTFDATQIEPGVVLGVADRTCTIPEGTKLFFPIVNFIYTNFNTPSGTPSGETNQELREFATFFADLIVPESLFLVIDRTPVPNLTSYRALSPTFDTGEFPEDNIFGVPGGTTGRAAADGYYALLKPLKPLPVGDTHTIHFGGLVDLTSIGGGYFIQDITYEITVSPKK